MVPVPGSGRDVTERTSDRAKGGRETSRSDRGHARPAPINGRLRFFDLDAGELIADWRIEGWDYGEFPAWSADGSGVYIDGGAPSRGRGRLLPGLLYISLEGEVTQLRQNWNEWITHPVPSRDGKRLAFAAQRDTGDVWVLEDF